MSKLSRRDFLKLSASLVGGAIFASASPLVGLQRDNGDKPNVVVLVLDSMSATHLSLLGYTRKTTPNLEWIANRSTVYHNHYSGGNFTTAGTASMLTGTYPWTHRAIGIAGLVDRSIAGQNIFALLDDTYYCFGFTQNHYSNLLLDQFAANLDEKLRTDTFSFQRLLPMPEESFVRDPLMAAYVFQEFLGSNGRTPASLSMGYAGVVETVATRGEKTSGYPLGAPTTGYARFNLDDLFSGLIKTLSGLAKGHAPFFAYTHLYPPHSPYSPKRSFLKTFVNDGVTFPAKPTHSLAESRVSLRDLGLERMFYDAYIADVDHSVGRFIQSLTKSGFLDSTYVIITSDHGELFERSEQGHGSPLLYESVTKIPLIVLAPGQIERRDVHSLTSNVDLVPSLLALAGKKIPAHIEGSVLPGLGGVEDAGRSVFTVFAKENSSFLPMEKMVATIVNGSKKLIYYRGYPSGYDGKIELYDLQVDPDELRDLSVENPVVGQRMKDELLNSLNDAERASQKRHGIGS